MIFEYDSEEIAWLRELLDQIMHVDRDSEKEVDLLVEALEYLEQNGYPCGC